jgi:hypothetical protein
MQFETLDEVLQRRGSFYHWWTLLNPADEYRALWSDCMRYWNALDLDRQRKLYYFVRKKKRTRQPIDPNPLEVTMKTRPYPENLNGNPQINWYMKNCKLVKAWYLCAYGIYLRQEAELWNMTRIEPLN